MEIGFEEIGYLEATFYWDGGDLGVVCKPSSNKGVEDCNDGDNFCGIIRSIHHGFAGVQLEGFAQVDYTGNALSVGYATLCANGSGGVKSGAGREYLVVSVDTIQKTAVIKL